MRCLLTFLLKDTQFSKLSVRTLVPTFFPSTCVISPYMCKLFINKAVLEISYLRLYANASELCLQLIWIWRKELRNKMFGLKLNYWNKELRKESIFVSGGKNLPFCHLKLTSELPSAIHLVILKWNLSNSIQRRKTRFLKLKIRNYLTLI